MPLIDARVAQSELVDRDAQVHRLEEVWAARPAVLVFLRHFS